MRKKGFALAVVFMIVLLLIIMLFGAIAAAHNTIFIVGNFQYRTASLYAAEAGVSRGIYELENNPAFQGEILENLRNRQGDYLVNIINPTGGNGNITIISTGSVGPFRRKVRVVVKRTANSYNAMSNEGPIILDRDVFINGIETLADPRKDAGNIHTNYAGNNAIDATSNASIFITGMATARGKITDKIPDDHSEENSERIEITPIDKAKLLSGGFPNDTIPSDGIIRANTEINGNLEVNGLLKIKNNSVLHVKGDLKLNHGIAGKGSIVVEGQCIIKGTANMEASNLDGIVVFSEGDLYLCSDNSSETATGGMDYSSNDEVATFFAKMPYQAPVWISHNLPQEAPKGIGFFRWYADNRNSTEPNFIKWKDGDPEDPILSPGLPREVKNWLELSPPIIDHLEQWYLVNK